MLVVVAAVIVVVVAACALWAILEQGPNAWLTLIRRYSIWPFALTVLAVAFLAGAIWAPRQTRIGLLFAAWWVVVLALWRRWGPGTIWRAARRCVLRARWPSVARAAGLGNTADRRSHEHPGGVVVTVGSDRIEYIPGISRGRSLPGGVGVTYQLEAARGSAIFDVRGVTEQLAGSLKVHRVIVRRIQAGRGTLTVLWRPTLHEVQGVSREEVAA